MYLHPCSVRGDEVRAGMQPAAHAQVQLSLPPPRVKNSVAAVQGNKSIRNKTETRLQR